MKRIGIREICAMFGDPAKLPLAFPRVPSETDVTEIKLTLAEFGLKIIEIAGGGDYLNPEGKQREFEITVEQMRCAHLLGAQYFRLCDIWPDSEDVFAKISGVIRKLGESAKELSLKHMNFPPEADPPKADNLTAMIARKRASYPGFAEASMDTDVGRPLAADSCPSADRPNLMYRNFKAHGLFGFVGASLDDALPKKGFDKRNPYMEQSYRLWRPNLKIIVENHGGIMTTGKQTRRLMEAVGLENVGVNYDPANYAYYGEDPLKALREIRPFVHFVHCKNVRFAKGHAEYCRLRDGVIDYQTIWPALFPEYRGYVCLEYEKAEDVELGTQDDLKYLREIGK